MSGVVYLVGAGPGDPGLITVRGRDLLSRAAVVVYDHLVNARLLDIASSAERIYAGKQASNHSMTQDQINALLIERARRGQCVVRLKGGDPFVFGRGGEECAALAAAGIRFEVVPGITAAIAVPAYAGIPVTHRDFNASFILTTGHEKEESHSDLDWSLLAGLPCIAFYMGLRSLPDICHRLMEQGKDPQTPAAAIQQGTTPRQRTATGTLATLAADVEKAKLSSPVLTIIGQVVSLRRTLNWFETRPLFGQTILVTRARRQTGELSLALEELGARVIEVPMIDVRPPEDGSAVDHLLSGNSGRNADFDWVVFTSVNGPAFAHRRLRELGRDARVFGQARVAAVGTATAQAIEQELGLHVDLCPPTYRSEALADALADVGQIAERRFLLLRADIARPVLRQRLREGGAAHVEDIAIYRTIPVTTLPQEALDAIQAGEVNWITFTSGSTARNFLSLLTPDTRRKIAHARIASIGPVTSAGIRELGMTPTLESTEATIPSLVTAIVEAS